jgi:hypothetical protein
MDYYNLDVFVFVSNLIVLLLVLWNSKLRDQEND